MSSSTNITYIIFVNFFKYIWSKTLINLLLGVTKTAKKYHFYRTIFGVIVYCHVNNVIWLTTLTTAVTVKLPIQKMPLFKKKILVHFSQSCEEKKTRKMMFSTDMDKYHKMSIETSCKQYIRIQCTKQSRPTLKPYNSQIFGAEIF